MGPWLAVGEGAELEEACARARSSGVAVERARSAEDAAARLSAPPTPALVLVGAPDAAAARALVAAVRGQVRGEAAALVALVPDLGAAEAALDAGAHSALPAPFSADVHAEAAGIDPRAAASMVFMTGGAFAPREQAFLASVPNRCLEKPLDARALRALLAGG